MTDHPPDPTVDEIFFGWSNEVGQLAVLGHSFTRPGVDQLWLSRLQPNIRLQPIRDDVAVPPTAFSYFEFDDGSAAVLRRMNTGHSVGRNHSHALVGSSRVLTVPVALGLSEWSGWLDSPPQNGQIQSFPASEIVNGGEVADRKFRPQVLQIENLLVTVLARILDNPGRSVTIVGCFPQCQLPLVWGLWAAADDYLRKAGRARRWSFSTYEDRHDVQVKNELSIVFVPAQPSADAPVQRTVLFVQDAPMHSEWTDRAQQLVSALIKGVPGPEPRREPAPVAAREAGVVSNGGSQAKGPIANVPFHGSGSAPSAPAGPAGRPVTADVGGGGPVPRATSVSTWSAGQSGSTGQHPAVVKLRKARTSGALMSALTDMEQEAQRGPNARENLRRSIDAETVLSVTQLVERDLPQAVYQRLTTAMFGENAADLENRPALKYADDLARSTSSDRLRLAVLDAMPRVEEEPEVVRARAARQPWATRALAAVSNNPRPAAILAGLTLLGLLLALWAGSAWFGGADGPTTSGAESGTATPTSPIDSSPTPPTQGAAQGQEQQTGASGKPPQVTLPRQSADEGSTYFGFLLNADETGVPLQACDPQARSVTCVTVAPGDGQTFAVLLVPNTEIQKVVAAAVARVAYPVERAWPVVFQR